MLASLALRWRASLSRPIEPRKVQLTRRSICLAPTPPRPTVPITKPVLIYCIILGLVLAWLAILGGCRLGWQLLHQNGRLLLRVEELEKRLNELFGDGGEPAGLPIG